MARIGPDGQETADTGGLSTDSAGSDPSTVRRARRGGDGGTDPAPDDPSTVRRARRGGDGGTDDDEDDRPPARQASDGRERQRLARADEGVREIDRTVGGDDTDTSTVQRARRDDTDSAAPATPDAGRDPVVVDSDEAGAARAVIRDQRETTTEQEVVAEVPDPNTVERARGDRAERAVEPNTVERARRGGDGGTGAGDEQFGDIAVENPATGRRAEADLEATADRTDRVVDRTVEAAQAGVVPVGGVAGDALRAGASERDALELAEAAGADETVTRYRSTTPGSAGPIETATESVVEGAAPNPAETALGLKEAGEFVATQPQRVAGQDADEALFAVGEAASRTPRGAATAAGVAGELAVGDADLVDDEGAASFRADVTRRVTRVAETTAEDAQSDPVGFGAGAVGALAGDTATGTAAAAGVKAATGVSPSLRGVARATNGDGSRSSGSPFTPLSDDRSGMVDPGDQQTVTTTKEVERERDTDAGTATDDGPPDFLDVQNRDAEAGDVETDMLDSIEIDTGPDRSPDTPDRDVREMSDAELDERLADLRDELDRGQDRTQDRTVTTAGDVTRDPPATAAEATVAADTAAVTVGAGAASAGTVVETLADADATPQTAATPAVTPSTEATATTAVADRTTQPVGMLPDYEVVADTTTTEAAGLDTTQSTTQTTTTTTDVDVAPALADQQLQSQVPRLDTDQPLDTVQTQPQRQTQPQTQLQRTIQAERQTQAQLQREAEAQRQRLLEASAPRALRRDRRRDPPRRSDRGDDGDDEDPFGNVFATNVGNLGTGLFGGVDP